MKVAEGVKFHMPMREFTDILFATIERIFARHSDAELVLTGALNEKVQPPEWHHLLGWAYDFRTRDLPRDRIILTCIDLYATLTLLDERYRVILFYDGQKHWIGETSSIDHKGHPEHVHVVLWQA